jgi:UDP-glucose 4-epimerase
VKVALVGGCGYLGSWLAERLIQEGHSVLSIHRSPRHEFSTEVQCLQINAANLDVITSALKDFDALVLLDSKNIMNQRPINPLENQSFRTVSWAIVEGLPRTQIRKIVFLSSGGALYDLRDPNKPATEEAEITINSNYAMEKIHYENFLSDFRAKNPPFAITCARISNVYGPSIHGIRPRGLITKALEAALWSKKLSVYGLYDVRDYVYAHDVVDFLSLAIAKTPSNFILNVGSGIGISNQQVIELIETYTQTSIGYMSFPRLEHAPRINIIDSSVAKEVLGWTPKTSFNDGLEKVIQTWTTSSL